MINFSKLVRLILFWGWISFTLSVQASQISLIHNGALAIKHQNELAITDHLVSLMLSIGELDSVYDQLILEIKFIAPNGSTVYERLAPIIRVGLSQVESEQDLVRMVSLADRFFDDQTNDNWSDQFSLLADEILQTSARKIKEFEVDWNCTWRCRCACSTNYVFIQETFQKHGYTLALAQPDKVKICREILDLNFSYLAKKFRDRCWIDCFQIGRWSWFCGFSLIIILVLLIIILFNIGQWLSK